MSTHGANNSQPELSANDARLLDQLVEAGFDRRALEPLTDAERERVNTICGLFGLLNDYPVDDADETLIHATMARVEQHERAMEDRRRLSTYREANARASGIGGFRMPNLIGFAAAILLATGVIWPVVSTMRQNAIDQACANNMRRLGYAFSAYAADHQGAMPVALAGIVNPRASWDTVSNVVNLSPLLEGQYCSRGHLNCPGNHEGRMYSYQWIQPGQRMQWGAGRVTVILGDRNPLAEHALSGLLAPADAMSPDHGGRGQNVLATDGSTIWLGDAPIVGRADNIWLPHGETRLRRGAQPASASDVMLVP